MDTSSTFPPSLPKKPQPAFEEFFELGSPETVSPFLTPASRRLGANLTLKAAVLAAVLLAVAFALSFSASTLSISYLLLIAVYVLAGIPSLIEAIEDLASLEVNIDILMTLAAFSSVLIGSGMEGGLLLVLFAISGAMEDAVTAKAKSAISSLNKLSPTMACVIDRDGTLLEKSVKDIEAGTKILIKSGQVVPLDGLVIEGISSVNLVHLTGENLPVRKQTGDTVPAGARNLEGALTLHVTHTSADSTLAKIIQLVTHAQAARPALQRWFDSLSRAYALSIIGLSAALALALPFLLSIPFLGVEGGVYRALTFLIAASPCALVIAIPIAYLSAVSACARKGILLKGGITLDALAKCRAAAFDKTGTLTTGELSCQGVACLEETAQEELKQALAVAHALEKNAVHPIARAINSFCQNRELPPVKIEDFKAIPGYGLEAAAALPEGRQKVYIGHQDYIIPQLTRQDAETTLSEIQAIQKKGELLAVLLIGKKLFIFRFLDTLRPKIRETVEALRSNRGWKTFMLTGDHAESARRIAQEAGIDQYFASLKPADKLSYVATLSHNRGLAMVGDGVNDAPALARATVGICMGKVGSTAAIDAADVVLLHDHIELLDWLVGKAWQTQRIVKQNLSLAAGAILIASLPALAGLVPLWLAVVLHEGGTVLVGLNGLRLLYQRH